MRAHNQSIPFFRSLSFLFLLVIAPLIHANDTALAPGDQPETFTSVRLSPGGFVGVDSLGRRWRYDFQSGLYTQDQSTPEEEQSFEFIDDRLPIEARATDEKTVPPLQESVIIGPDEFVKKDIIATGRITVRGWAKGNVQSLSGRVLITETGQVDGNVIAPEVVVKDGGVVRGKIQETGVSIDLSGVRGAFDFGGIILVIVFTLALMIASFVITALPSKHVDVMARCSTEYRWRALIWGWISIFLIPVAMLLLAITIIGALALPLVPFAILYVFFVSVTIFARSIGEGALKSLFRMRDPGAHLSTQFGVLLYMSFWLITAILLGSSDEVSQGFGIFFLVTSIILSSYLLFIGLGSAILSRGGTRQYLLFIHTDSYRDQSQAPAPAPPPIPDAPNRNVGPLDSETGQ